MAHSNICYSRRWHKDASAQALPLRLASCLVVEDKDGKILMTKRSPKMRVFPHAWVLPGGHIEQFESLEAGVVREIMEETGISIEMDKSGAFSYQGREVTLVPYFLYESSIS